MIRNLQTEKSPLSPLCQRGETTESPPFLKGGNNQKSPFFKGGFRGISWQRKFEIVSL